MILLFAAWIVIVIMGMALVIICKEITKLERVLRTTKEETSMFIRGVNSRMDGLTLRFGDTDRDIKFIDESTNYRLNSLDEYREKLDVKITRIEERLLYLIGDDYKAKNPPEWKDGQVLRRKGGGVSLKIIFDPFCNVDEPDLWSMPLVCDKFYRVTIRYIGDDGLATFTIHGVNAKTLSDIFDPKEVEIIKVEEVKR